MITTRHPNYFRVDFDGEVTEEKSQGLYSGDIFLLPYRDPKFGEEQHLATLRGASVFPTSERFYPMWHIDVSHNSAYDHEHDGVHLLRLKIENPVVYRLYPAEIEVVGTIAEIYAYDLKGGPFSGVGDYNDTFTDEVEDCSACHKTHQTGRYLPPKNKKMKKLIGSVVHIKLNPLK
jgi:hypothetical protein